MKSCLFAFVFLGAASLGWSPVLASDLQPQTLEAANGWFLKQKISKVALQSMPVSEAAKRLNQAVYDFCETGQAPGDLDELFKKCTAACGGYSYVLRGLLESLGAETRFANFYNIPNQGNHTAVEVKDEAGKWGLLDPTFGAFFTADGNASGPLLSARQVGYDIDFGTLDKHVLQSGDKEDDFLSRNLSELYSYKFEHEFMTLQNYQLAERMTSYDGAMLSLDIFLKVVDGSASVGSMTPDTPEALEQNWLKVTNTILTDAEPENDISFVASFLPAIETRKFTTVTIDDLTPRKQYTLSLLLVGTGETGSRVQVSGVGKGVRSPTVVFDVKRGAHHYEFNFNPQRDFAQFQVVNVAGQSDVRLFGIDVAENLGRSKNF